MAYAFHYRPFRVPTSLIVAAAALLLLAPTSLSPARADTLVAAAVATHSVTPIESARPQAAPASSAGNTTDTASPEQTVQPKTLTAKAVDKVKQVARSAADIFSRVPCLSPKGVNKAMGTLPHVANKLISGRPVLIIAFGSSSTQGYGSSAPEFAYPNRLAAQLKRQYPNADITVLNRGVGGEDAPEMMKRLQTEVIDMHPDLVIWQVGTNAVLRDLDPVETGKLVDDGVSRIQAAGSDIVLVDPQYSPRVTERPERAGKIVQLLGKVAELHHVGLFPRFKVMRDWHEKQALPVDSFVIADGLHMNDWGYACFAQLLGDDIIRSVGQIKIGVNVPAAVQTYRPM
jgi:lysophospholipase L1-like esterase